MRSETEIREKLVKLLEYNRDALNDQRADRISGRFDRMKDESISNRGGIITGLCWALGFEGTIDFMESEVLAGRASLGAELDAKIKNRFRGAHVTP